MAIYFCNKDGTVEELEQNDEEIDVSPDCWNNGAKIEAGKCKDFSGKFMFPEENKDLN